MNHILIIEDDKTLSSGIALALKSNALAFHQAFSVPKAKAVMDACEIHLFLLDINLPGTARILPQTRDPADRQRHGDGHCHRIGTGRGRLYYKALQPCRPPGPGQYPASAYEVQRRGDYFHRRVSV